MLHKSAFVVFLILALAVISPLNVYASALGSPGDHSEINTQNNDKDKEIKRQFIPEETLFIGNSLTHGLSLYGKMPESTYLYSTGMTIFRASTDSFETPYGSWTTVANAVVPKKHKSVYILLGINEIGSDIKAYIDAYDKFITYIRDLLPDADVYIQNILPASSVKNAGGIFTKARIDEYNKALLTLAEDRECHYVDLYTLFADESGFLPLVSTWDGIHLNAGEYIRWVEYLKNPE